MNATNPNLVAVKAALKTALQLHHGDPKQPEVAAAIAQLIRLSPEAAPAYSERLIGERWRLISAPSFPNGMLNEDGTYSYTLGRLAFNMFRPIDLQVVIDQVTQPVMPIPDSDQLTHDIHVTFTVHDPRFPPLRGMVQNLGICEPASDDALAVEFTGGKLLPLAETDRAQWQALFGKPSHRSGLKAGLSTLMLKLLFGLVPPQNMAKETGELQFGMQRSPRGKLTILYLDQDLRITKGEKGTVLVCER